jgi:hypothetical protein
MYVPAKSKLIDGSHVSQGCWRAVSRDCRDSILAEETRLPKVKMQICTSSSEYCQAAKQGERDTQMRQQANAESVLSNIATAAGWCAQFDSDSGATFFQVGLVFEDSVHLYCIRGRMC